MGSPAESQVSTYARGDDDQHLQAEGRASLSKSNRGKNPGQCLGRDSPPTQRKTAETHCLIATERKVNMPGSNRQ